MAEVRQGVLGAAKRRGLASDHRGLQVGSSPALSAERPGMARTKVPTSIFVLLSLSRCQPDAMGFVMTQSIAKKRGTARNRTMTKKRSLERSRAEHARVADWLVSAHHLPDPPH